MSTRRAALVGGIVAPGLAAGAGLALSLPPWGFWPLAFPAAGLLYWRLHGKRLAVRLTIGWVAGLGCFVPGLWWAASFNWYGAAVLMVAEALSMAIAACLTPPTRGRLPAFAGAFTLLEAVRLTWPFGGLPLGGVFLGQAGGPLLGTARLGGPLLLTALVWLGGAGLGELALAAAVPTPPGSPARRRRSLVGAGALAVTVGIGLASIWAPDGGPAVRTLPVAAVQGGGRRGTSAQEVDPAGVFEAQVAATGRLPASLDPGPRLVVWPEDVIALSGPLAGSPEQRTVAALARHLRATVVAGVTQPASSTSFRNFVAAWSPQGKIVGTFEKVHRVPFGEYVPFRGFFSHLANLSAVPRDAVPGHGNGLLRTPAAPLGVMISYEVFFADRGRSSVRAGAQLLVVPTNTSSYSTSQVPSQELAADRVQAVAEGRDLVQAAPTGYSSVVDHRGAVLERSALGARQVLTATVALRDGSTLYERWGDLPVLAAATLALVGGWVRAVMVVGRPEAGDRPGARLQ
jgi:apolipoprotein N-acyltransferase